LERGASASKLPVGRTDPDIRGKRRTPKLMRARSITIIGHRAFPASPVPPGRRGGLIAPAHQLHWPERVHLEWVRTLLLNSGPAQGLDLFGLPSGRLS